MYESSFGCRTQPFSLVPDPSFLFLGRKHKVALSLLEYGLLNRAVFTVITGEPGTGKTTLLNTILGRSTQQVTLGVLSNTHAGLGSLMPWVFMAFGLESKRKDSVDLYRGFSHFLTEEIQKQRRVVLVIDEAQNLGAAMLEELRLLSNVNDGRRRPLQIILSGQPGLRSLLQRGELVQFAQRISVDYHLEPFDECETPVYIRHRLMVAGASRPVFTDLACQVVHRLTGGNARLINQVCEISLAYGFAQETRLLTARLVMHAAQDRAASGILPLVQAPIADLFSPDAEAAEAVQIQGEARVDQDTPVVRGGAGPTSLPGANSYEQGLAYKEAGQFRQAMICFEQAGLDCAMRVKAKVQIALCLRASDRLEDAAMLLKDLLIRKEGTPGERRQVRYFLGRVYESLGQTEQARAHYALLQKEAPSFRDAAARLARLTATRSAPEVLVRSFCGSWFRSVSKGWT